MTITLRVDKGSPLTIAELDGNFTDLDGRLELVEDGQATVKSIDNIEQVDNSLIVNYTDETTDGPFTFDVTITYRGDWEPATIYAVNDLVKANGNVYIVLTAHTSEAVFDPGANSGTAEDYYGLFLEMPELSLPVGGDAGTVLTKVSGDDYDTQWTNAGVPAGGATSQILVKTSGDDYDTEWIDPNEFTSASVAATVIVDELTLNIAVNGFYMRCTHVAGCVITVPDDASAEFAIGSEMHFRQCTSGQLIFTTSTAGDPTINGIDGFENATNRQGAVVTLKKVNDNEWDLFGLLAETSA